MGPASGRARQPGARDAVRGGRPIAQESVGTPTGGSLGQIRLAGRAALQAAVNRAALGHADADLAPSVKGLGVTDPYHMRSHCFAERRLVFAEDVMLSKDFYTASSIRRWSSFAVID